MTTGTVLLSDVSALRGRAIESCAVRARVRALVSPAGSAADTIALEFLIVEERVASYSAVTK